MDQAAVMNSCDDKAQRLGIAGLTETERVVVLVSRANFEVELGGLSSFYYNSAGDHAAETVTALKAVGSFKAAAAVEAANGLFPGGPAANRKQRSEELRRLGERAKFNLLDSEFYAERPDVFSRLCLFIDKHEAELAEHNETVR